MYARSKVLSDLWFRVNEVPYIIARDFLLSFSFSILIALCSQVAIPLSFTPVPITGQTFAVFLTGILLGRNRALMAVLLYVLEGILGFPVFAPGGAVGIARLLGPTGGYILGFAVSAYFLGFMAERGWDRTFLKTITIMVGATFILYTFGLIVLSAFVPANKVFALGFLPFIPGDLAKILLVSTVLPFVWKLIKD